MELKVVFGLGIVLVLFLGGFFIEWKGLIKEVKWE